MDTEQRAGGEMGDQDPNPWATPQGPQQPVAAEQATPQPPPPQQGYPQQPGYPPLPPQGAPPQPGYPQQQGYPQQPGFPAQSAYPQPGYGQQPYPQQVPPQYTQPYPQAQQPGYGTFPSAPTAAYDANPYATGAPWAPGPQQGWAPPPKPGLIPLRPLSFSDLFGAPFLVLRRNPKATFGSALLLQGLTAVLSLVIVGVVTWLSLSRLSQAAPGEEDAISAGAITAIILSFLIPVAVSIAGSAILQGIIAQEVARGTLGEKLPLGVLWRRTKARFVPLIGYTFLLIGVVTVFIAVAVGLGFVLTGLGGTAGVALTVVMGIGALLVLIAASVWLGTKFSLTPSIIVLENGKVFPSLARSWRLTDGYFWRTFGVQFLVSSVVSVASQVVATPISLLASLVPVLFVGVDSEATMIVATIAAQGLSLLVSVIIGAITVVVISATSAVIYVDLRMRKEGLDLDLARFVEARAGGRETVDNPFDVAAAGGKATR
ncbi:hypothetical protein SAMN06295974_3292 [Plantibacter flavus]|uniref:DUF7847 domain-containing protein n=1 Tax=Plantibacter flavus TaxID=150123 RepID=A0A3N2C4E5_9MICO|nr:hypothetical protein [Plantibacter flavus]ROR82397.1 hypothetical protein EDD42_2487 [Plantibacter flavus]SMG43847.1 hypothetical protein SAMN06295974_3292 [Plantibacter flavus]